MITIIIESHHHLLIKTTLIVVFFPSEWAPLYFVVSKYMCVLSGDLNWVDDSDLSDLTFLFSHRMNVSVNFLYSMTD